MTTLADPIYVPPAPAPEPVSRFDARVRERLSVTGLLVGTALLYLWGLGASGYGNDFYAAAVQAGTKSWKAFFFGSFDSSNFITVDKPPLSLWPMELSGRLFGFNSWSMLAPQALEGVLAVWLLYATVKRWFGPRAALLSGALLAVTPVAVLMFRYNQPDALMTLLLVAAAYFVTRALESASTKWLLLCGAAMGLSFLAKGLQPFTVLPALALVYVVAAPTSLRRRLLQLLAAGGALVAAAGWWVLAVDLTPAADRPYIGGSGNNSALGLAFGYNGVSRITGSSGGPGGGGSNFSGSTGIGRLFNSLNGGQIAWLLPAAVIASLALAVVTRGRPRTDRTRAALILFGGWLLVTALVLSYASGIIHTYYSVEIAPAIAAVVGIGAVVLWEHRTRIEARIALAAAISVTGIWSYTLLHRTPSWHPWIGQLVLAAAVVSGLLILLPPGRIARSATVGAVAGLVALGGGSAAYAIDTAATAHNGSIPSAGPAIANSGGFGGPGGARQGGFGRPTGGFTPPSGGFTPPSGGQFPGSPSSGTSTLPNRTGGTGGIGGTQNVSSAMTALLKATTSKWAAAAIGSQTAGPLELASGKAVMSIGGFNGGDAAPTLAQFEKYVAAGQIHYFIAGGNAGGGPGGSNGSSSAITSWVAAHFTAQTVGGMTVYDLTTAATSS
jgi:4-amino-4-deoxy-L-arabinose transferase-like glycosyltransferase